MREKKFAFKLFHKGLLLTYIICIAVMFFCLIYILRFNTLMEFLRKQRKPLRWKGLETGEVIDMVALVSGTRFFLIRNNCYKKSLILFYILNKLEVEKLRLYIGITKTQEKLKGHSWVTLNDNPLLDDEAFIKEYRVIYTTGA